MNTEEFKHIIKKGSKFNNVFNYFLCLSVVSGGVFCLYEIFSNSNWINFGMYNYIDFLFPLFLLSIGFYGFWRIPKDYLVECIKSSKSIEEKNQLIINYLSDFKKWKVNPRNNYLECSYTNKFLNAIDLIFYIDEEKVLFNVQSYGSSGGGFIDFGLASRARKKLKRYLITCL